MLYARSARLNPQPVGSGAVCRQNQTELEDTSWRAASSAQKSSPCHTWCSRCLKYFSFPSETVTVFRDHFFHLSCGPVLPETLKGGGVGCEDLFVHGFTALGFKCRWPSTSKQCCSSSFVRSPGPWPLLLQLWVSSRQLSGTMNASRARAYHRPSVLSLIFSLYSHSSSEVSAPRHALL